MKDWLKDKLFYSWYYPLKSFYEQVERMYFWAKAMRHSYDFDGHTVYEVLYLKLDRLQQGCLKHGNCVWDGSIDTKLMKRLSEARMLAKRLSEEKIDMRAFSEAEERFGFISRFEDSDEHGYSTLKTDWKRDRKNAKLFYKARTKLYVKVKQDEKDRFYYLLDKYLEQWWD